MIKKVTEIKSEVRTQLMLLITVANNDNANALVSYNERPFTNRSIFIELTVQ
jgi:hypothetical protein